MKPYEAMEEAYKNGYKAGTETVRKAQGHKYGEQYIRGVKKALQDATDKEERCRTELTDRIISRLEEWMDSIGDDHRDPFVEEETLELVIDIIKQEAKI